MRVRCMYAFCWWSRLRHHDVRPKGLMGRRKGERTPRSEPREGRHVLEAEEAPAVHLCFKVKHPAHLSEQQLGHHHQHQGRSVSSILQHLASPHSTTSSASYPTPKPEAINNPSPRTHQRPTNPPNQPPPPPPPSTEAITSQSWPAKSQDVQPSPPHTPPDPPRTLKHSSSNNNNNNTNNPLSRTSPNKSASKPPTASSPAEYTVPRRPHPPPPNPTGVLPLLLDHPPARQRSHSEQNRSLRRTTRRRRRTARKQGGARTGGFCRCLCCGHGLCFVLGRMGMI